MRAVVPAQSARGKSGRTVLTRHANCRASSPRRLVSGPGACSEARKHGVPQPVEHPCLALGIAQHHNPAIVVEDGEVELKCASWKVYRSWFRDRQVVLADDFNHNVIWDRPGVPAKGHTRTITAARDVGLVSAYHAWTGEAFGAETQPTHYWRDRKADGFTYHIDYAFVPEEWSARMTECSVGDFTTWVGSRLSDHVPLTIEVDTSR